MAAINWASYPQAAAHPATRAFIESLTKRQQAPKTVDAYARNLEDLLRTWPDAPPERILEADAADLEDYVALLRVRNPARPGRASGPGLADATIQQRLVTLKLRQADFQTITRQRALAAPTDLAGPLAAAVDELLAEALSSTGWRRIRLLGVRVSGLGPLVRQLDLFSAAPLQDAKLSKALHELEGRFGARVIRRAAALGTDNDDRGG